MKSLIASSLFVLPNLLHLEAYQCTIPIIHNNYISPNLITYNLKNPSISSSITSPTKAKERQRLVLAANNNDNDDFDFGAFKRGSDITDLPEKASFGYEEVPELQRPANEYLELVRSPLFAWASSDKGLLIRLAAFYVVIFALISYPIAGASYTEEGFLYQKLAAANVGTLGLVIALLVRLFSGWGYVGSRLSSDFVEYEETGWFDGAREKKNKSERARDLFLYQSDVKPVVDRVKFFSLAAGGLWVASCFALNVATNAKPVFNSYDPNMLMQLQGNDKLADYASKQSQGRPTYCNNRYYRAIATDGGQGCEKYK